MSTQYCKVGKTKPNLKKLLNLEAAEEKAVSFIEVIYKNKPLEDLNVVS
ncbi:hypothetical protein [Oceanihabitans sediminis]|nr:hypothetical protein [Oceanihabitans sediminis]MDX1774049.1 hypothetical protein [Oceanihabitans sediminis]